jgi:hypothetical protein
VSNPENESGEHDIVIRELPVSEIYVARFGDGQSLLFSQIMLMNRAAPGERRRICFVSGATRASH